jgi:hypothetical protein
VACDLRVVDSGPDKIKEVDRQWHTDYVRAHGVQAMRRMGLNAMEADWVAARPG